MYSKFQFRKYKVYNDYFRFSRKFSKTCIQLHLGHNHPKIVDPNDGKEGRKITWVGVGVNLGLAIGKGIGGYFGQSQAMIADAVHSLSDLLTDAVTLWSHRLAREPWSETHPYGHGKYEAVGAMAVSIALFFTGVGISMHSIENIITIENISQIPTPIALVAAILAIAFKEVLFYRTMSIAKKERSEVLVANAWHHRSDSISTFVALLGVIGSMMGYPLFDPCAGLVVAVLIINTSKGIFFDSVRELTDNQEIEQELLQNVSEVLSTLQDVKSHHNLRARKMGNYSLVDFHITVDPKLSVTSGHQIAENARIEILRQIPVIREALIHVEGNTQSKPEEDFKLMTQQSTVINDIKKAINDNLILSKEIKVADHFVIHYLNESIEVMFSIQLNNSQTTIKEATQIAEITQDVVKTQIPYVTSVAIKLELSG